MNAHTTTVSRRGHPGRGAKKASPHQKGRQTKPRAQQEVQDVIGTELRSDLLQQLDDLHTVAQNIDTKLGL